MGNWWNTRMSDAGQAMYQDPKLALQMATIPDNLITTPEQYERDKKATQTEEGGWWKSTLDFLGKADGALENIPVLNKGYQGLKTLGAGLWYPVDKAATGARWLYSNGVSQPLSTVFIQAAKSDIQDDWGQFFDGSEWKDAWGQAEHVSPGQAVVNYENVMAASGEPGALAPFFGLADTASGAGLPAFLAGGPVLGLGLSSVVDSDFVTGDNWKYTGGLNEEQRNQVKRQQERFLYDSEYWRKAAPEKYTKGTGALDFFFVVAGDPLAPVIGAVSGAVKGARSVQTFARDGELFRDRGTAVNLARGLTGKKAERLEDTTNGGKFNDFYDWVVAPSKTGADRKTASEIAQHPIWGRGRRINPFANQFGEVLAKMDRDDMPLVLRMAHGDNEAIKVLAAKGNGTLDEIGRLSDNRTHLNAFRFDDEILSHFYQKALSPQANIPFPSHILFYPPTPRPTTPGPAQAGWDLRWGPLAERAAREEPIYQGAAEQIAKLGQVRPMSPFGGIGTQELAEAETWRLAKMDLIQEEVLRLQSQNSAVATMLGANLGRTEDEILAASSQLFGTLDRSYRMGGFGLRSPQATAEAKVSKMARDRSGFWVNQTYRKGYYGTPVHMIRSLGDRAPEGRVNHNDTDAPDRVMDMLKRVPGLTEPERLILHDRYMSAGSKPDRSKALAEIQGEVLTHMATRVHGLDPEVGQLIKEMTEVGIGATMAKLTRGKTVPTSQAFSAAERPGMATTTKNTVDWVDSDGAMVLAPLAKTQLSMTDTLLPVDEIERVLARNSGAMKQLRRGGGTALDTVQSFTDQFNSLWKATTLLRPAYTIRSVSEEIALSAVKFGAFSRLIADPSQGAANFVRNKAVYVAAEFGLKSYVPPTGGKAASRMAVVRIDDPNIITNVNRRKNDLKKLIDNEPDPIIKAQYQAEHDAIGVKRIRVNSALPIVENRIKMEAELAGNLQKDINRWQSEIQKLQAGAGQTVPVANSLKIQAMNTKIADAQVKIAEHQAIMDEFADYSNEILRVAKDAIGARMFEGEFEAFGRKLPQAFTRDEQWTHTIPREQISSDTANRAVFGRAEAIDVGRMIKSGSWTYLEPKDAGHMEAWLRGINLQWRQDEVFRFVAEDPTGTKALDWLKTPDGLKHLRDLGGYRSPKELVSDVKLTLDKYLPEDTGLWPKFAKGDEITPADLRANIPANEFPTVHGEEMAESTAMFAKDTPGSIVDRIVAKGFNRLGTIPSDLLSRNPVFARQYEARMRTALAQEMEFRKSIGAGDDFTVAEINAMREKADRLARSDLRQVVYDPKRTNASEALRFIYPFMSAHTDSIARWGGMIGEKPQMVNTVSKIYNAPVSANLVTDGSGNPVGNDGKAERRYLDERTGKIVTKREDVPIEERVFHLRAPWDTKDKGSIPIKLQALNTILPGDPWFNPGSGPLVQMAGSEIAKKSPTTGDFLQWAKILPYGPTDNSKSIFPKYMRTIWDRYKAGDPDGEEYQKAYLAIYNKKVAEYHASGGKKKVILADIDKEAKAFLNLQILEAWGSPAQSQATPLTGSPYQFFVDQYRQLKDADPENASDIFLQRYGPEYFGFTASLSKSMGIAATVSADAMAQKYKTEIGLDPEMAPFWIGNVYNGGPFSDSVYQKQLEESFGGEWVREKITAQDAITRNQVQAGWAMYRKAKLNLDNMLIRSGHRSYQERGAEGLNQAKKNLVANISAQYPGWGEAFMVTDRGKIPQRIEFFQRAAMDERLLNDPMRSEMAPLVRYLQLRSTFKQELARRGASQLSFDVAGGATGENADLARAWDYQVTSLLNSSVSFNELYNRYLSNDHLQ